MVILTIIASIFILLAFHEFLISENKKRAHEKQIEATIFWLQRVINNREFLEFLARDNRYTITKNKFQIDHYSFSHIFESYEWEVNSPQKSFNCKCHDDFCIKSVRGVYSIFYPFFIILENGQKLKVSRTKYSKKIKQLIIKLNELC